MKKRNNRFSSMYKKGEEKVMMPELEYYFKNTKNVLETPLKR